MRAYHLESPGSVDGLVVRKAPNPKPGLREVAVRIRATSLNFRDLMILNNAYFQPVTPGVIPLSDGAGEVVALGEGASRFKVGDRVAATFHPKWIAGRITHEHLASRFAPGEHVGAGRDGLLTDYKVLNEEALVAIPPHLSFEEAATLPCAAVTAWSALTAPRQLAPGETVLTLGTGGVSIFALQLAKAFGARVIATTSSDEKATRLGELGADVVINYRTTPDWEREVRSATDGRGVDCVVEVGGAGTLARSLACAGPECQVSLIGVLAGKGGSFDMTALQRGLVSLRRIGVGSRQDFELMNRAITHQKLRPVIDRVFPFEDAKSAYRYLESQKHFGKVVVSHE
ncbi:NAD(P)-dependent alcohol dehydrogenase [Bradyrhizobium sp. LHD-71]|uniref:zinc-dependent alcohol dehydrogenase family protein n=1 Tax=Bradyrhizobium sp. LHD-71 TaxID=3072141 RepID=UPI0028100888|nr:NAD(P)-dependent alcohol dehydrogenase [Bradyrhizobium sp. LHD-71]MDQ8728897.1 NAD(P)-dependent alcohol dehydrogenase [Bradyrhizobium sp. LHD-71]